MLLGDVAVVTSVNIVLYFLQCNCIGSSDIFNNGFSVVVIIWVSAATWWRRRSGIRAWQVEVETHPCLQLLFFLTRIAFFFRPARLYCTWICIETWNVLMSRQSMSSFIWACSAFRISRPVEWAYDDKAVKFIVTCRALSRPECWTLVSSWAVI